MLSFLMRFGVQVGEMLIFNRNGLDFENKGTVFFDINEVLREKYHLGAFFVNPPLSRYKRAPCTSERWYIWALIG